MSRSRMRNLTDRERSVRSRLRLRACWMTLWVPTTHPTRSCYESVLVNEAAEDSIST